MKRKITLQDLRSSGTNAPEKKPISLDQLRKKGVHAPSTKIKTKNGYMIRFVTAEGIVAFFTDNALKHRAWEATRNNPLLLPTKQEYHRIKTAYRLPETTLSPDEIAKCASIVRKLKDDPYLGLTDSERSYLGIAKMRKKAEQEERQLPAMERHLRDLGVKPGKTIEERKKEDAVVVAGNFYPAGTNLGLLLRERLK